MLKKSFILIMLILSNRCWSVLADTPVRPTYQDVSVKVFEGNLQDAYRWYRGRVATQLERDAMEETANLAVSETVRLLQKFPECSSQLGYAIANWNKITSKLGGGYEDNSLLSNIWEIGGAQGRHYSFEQYILLKSRDCLVTSNVAAKCAQNISPDMADLLNLKIAGGKCVKGADFEVIKPLEPYVEATARKYPVQVKTPAKILTKEQHDLLHKTHEAHTLVSKWRCEGGTPPPAGIVDRAHADLEASAVDKEQQHFFMMKRFNGFVAVDKEQECKWAKLQDKFHEAWMAAVGHTDRSVAWHMARRADADHQLAHFCMNVNHPDLKVQFSCPNKKRILDCEVLTCNDALKKYSAIYGVN